jgi:copper chaperone CopZ
MRYMRILMVAALGFVVMLGAVGCVGQARPVDQGVAEAPATTPPAPPAPPAAPAAGPKTVVLMMPDMECETSAMKVEFELGAMAGVSDIVTDIDNRMTTITMDPAVVTIEAIKASMLALGYQVREVRDPQ